MRPISLLGYNRDNNLYFKLKGYSAKFMIDFQKERIIYIKGYAPKSVKKKLRAYMYEHYDLKSLNV